MKKILITILITFLILFPVSPSYGANTKSIALVGSDCHFLSISDASQTGLTVLGDFSFMTWYKFDSLPSSSNIMTFVAKKESADGYYIDIQASSDKLQVQTEDGNVRTQIFSDEAFIVTGDLDTWFHFALTFDASAKEMIAYKNGSVVATSYNVRSGTSIGATTVSFNIGSYNIGGFNTFDGKLDEVGMYSIELSQATVQADYNSGNGTERSSSETGIIGGWRMEDNLLDETANDNDLTWNYDSGSTTPVYSTDVPFSGGQPATIPKKTGIIIFD